MRSLLTRTLPDLTRVAANERDLTTRVYQSHLSTRSFDGAGMLAFKALLLVLHALFQGHQCGKWIVRVDWFVRFASTAILLARPFIEIAALCTFAAFASLAALVAGFVMLVVISTTAFPILLGGTAVLSTLAELAACRPSLTILSPDVDSLGFFGFGRFGFCRCGLRVGDIW